MMRLYGFVLLSALLAPMALAVTDLDDPAEPWKEGTVGVSTDVPAPFEPLSAEGSLVSCWGRDYSLASPFPEQVTSQDEALLAGPVRLLVGAETVSGGDVELTLARADRIEFGGSADVAGVQIQTTGWIEYDGAMQINLTVSPQQATEIDRLAVEIPFRPEIAKYLHVSRQWGKYVYERIGTDPDWQWQLDWQSLVWIGDDYRGLTFVTERATWTGPAEQALQVRRQPDAVVFTANLINEKTQLDGPRTYTIGLQATPGKPLPDDWHGRHVGSGGVATGLKDAATIREEGRTVALIWHTDTRWFSYPQAADAEAFVAAVKAYHDAGMRAVVYVTLSGTGPESEVEKRHHDEWMMSQKGEPLFVDPGVEGKSHGLTSTCPASGYTDWLVWAIDRAMEDYDLDGVYIDNAGPYYCDNESHGCRGETRVRYPYFANRELHKRLWSVIHGRKPETGLIWEHNSCTSNSFNLTFTDIYSDGEHFRVLSKGKPEEITLDFLDMTATGRQWGSQACFLPSALNLREEYTDWLLTRTLPFGNVLMSVPTWMDYSRVSAALRARLKFGLGEEPVEWFTPEALPEWLPVGPPELLVGAYLREDKRLLLTIANPTDDKLAARLDLRKTAPALGASVKVTDAMTGAGCPPLGPVLVLSVPANSFRMVVIEPDEG